MLNAKKKFMMIASIIMCCMYSAETNSCNSSKNIGNKPAKFRRPGELPKPAPNDPYLQYLKTETSYQLTNRLYDFLKQDTVSISIINCEQLLQIGAETNSTNHGNGTTRLQEAAWHGHTDVINLLIQYNANIDATSDPCALGGKADALALAAISGHTEICRLLILARAKVNIDDTKTTRIAPLYAAALYNQPKSVEYLLLHGANPNTINHRQIYNNAMPPEKIPVANTAFYATESDLICKLLIAYGATAIDNLAPEYAEKTAFLSKLKKSYEAAYPAEAAELRQFLLSALSTFIVNIKSLILIIIDYAVPADFATQIGCNIFETQCRSNALYPLPKESTSPPTQQESKRNEN